MFAHVGQVSFPAGDKTWELRDITDAWQVVKAVPNFASLLVLHGP